MRKKNFLRNLGQTMQIVHLWFIKSKPPVTHQDRKFLTVVAAKYADRHASL
jgi:hypothetical protein